MINYLSNGKSSERPMPGENCSLIIPSRGEIRWINGRWLIVDDGPQMLDFSGEGQECLSAVQVIKKYGFFL